MNRADEPLDSAPLRHTPLTLYRIARSKYADLSGIGAAKMPGRWNRLGQEMIYTSVNSSTAQLEVLGHTKKQFLPANLVRMRLMMAGDWKDEISAADVLSRRERNTGASMIAFLTIKAADDILLLLGDMALTDVLAMAVPSVHDDQWNVLLRPSSRHFEELVSLIEVKPFSFDSRLFPEEAVEEQTQVTNNVMQEITLREFQAGDGDAFRRLNEEWITRYFKLEPKDLLSLNDPQHYILEKGGRIVFAFRGDEALGCCALLPMSDGVFEIAKMAVTEAAQGQGVGRRVLQFAVGVARDLGARELYLETNHALTPAIRLYESVGFRHVPAERVVPSPYARADVFMEMRL